MSGIDREQVRHLARLARLELSADEIDRLAEELDRVLSRFRELEASGVSGDEAEEVHPGGSGGAAGEGSGAGPGRDGRRLRPDSPEADPLERPPGEMAPEWKDGFFLVPRLEGLGGDRGPGGDGNGGGNGG